MQRLVYFTGEKYHVRDNGGRWYQTSTPELYATAAEIREAHRQHEAAQYPLPSYDPNSGLYCWGNDTDDQYTDDEISDDLCKIGWPAESVPLLLELARLCAKLGVTD